MEESCKTCVNIDLQKLKIKVNAVGNVEKRYWCERLKKYIPVDLFTCDSYKYDKSIQDYHNQDNDKGTSRSRNK